MVIDVYTMCLNFDSIRVFSHFGYGCKYRDNEQATGYIHEIYKMNLKNMIFNFKASIFVTNSNLALKNF